VLLFTGTRIAGNPGLLTETVAAQKTQKSNSISFNSLSSM
jgi:hypothetical protein